MLTICRRSADFISKLEKISKLSAQLNKLLNLILIMQRH